MKKTILNGLTTTALMTILGTTVFFLNGLNKALASNGDQNLTQTSEISTPELTTDTTTASIQNSVTPTILNPVFQDQTAIANIRPHAWKDGRLAVTLRVRNIPMITFLGTKADLTTLINNQNFTSPDNPMVRAQAIADQINQLANDPNFNAENITVGVDKSKRTYNIQINQNILVSLNKNTILPDTTRNLGKDALQMANRLRRIMGDAAPLTSVAKVLQPSNLIENTLPMSRVIKRGVASWYGPGFHGRRTANGERYNQNAYTAAHKTLPFGTKLRVTNLRNGQSVMVRINDRGPYVGRRVIDLSAGAARAIGVYGSGTAPVQLELMSF